MKRIYLDYAAATPIDDKVNDLVFRYSKKFSGNASSLYYSGREAKRIIRESKENIGKVWEASPEEIIFTGSGTESDNLAIFGVARAHKKQGRHIVVSAIEHLAVLRACDYLEKHEGFEITRLPVNKSGIIELETFKRSLRKDTVLVSMMYANNEIGTVQPIAKFSKAIREFRKFKIENLKLKINVKTPFFHVDACQAAGALDINVQRLGVDLMTLNGSKIYGPKGTGLLFVRRGIRLTPMVIGGSQERGLRAGTENPALIAGLAKALEMADKNKAKESKRLVQLRGYLITAVLKKIPDARLNGDPGMRLPNNTNFSFKDIDGEMLVYKLDEKGIEVSTGSACTSTAMGTSHVIRALGGDKNYGNLRVTLGHQTTKKELEYFVKVLPSIIEKLAH